MKKELSLDTQLVMAIQKGIDPELLKIVQTKDESLSRRREAFSRIRYSDNDAVLQLWNKYKLFVKKMKFKLIATARNNNMRMANWIEDYDQIAFERFLWCVCVVRLEDCKHLWPTWGIYQHLWGNFMAMNRDLVKEFLKKSDAEEQIYGYTDGDNDREVTNLDRAISKKPGDLSISIISNIEKKLFWDSWELTKCGSTDIQRQIIQLRQQEVKPKEIRDALCISVKKYKTEIEEIKNLFSSNIEFLADKRNLDIDYKKIMENFA
jgi:hypothetical protein